MRPERWRLLLHRSRRGEGVQVAAPEDDIRELAPSKLAFGICYTRYIVVAPPLSLCHFFLPLCLFPPSLIERLSRCFSFRGDLGIHSCDKSVVRQATFGHSSSSSSRKSEALLSCGRGRSGGRTKEDYRAFRALTRRNIHQSFGATSKGVGDSFALGRWHVFVLPEDNIERKSNRKIVSPLDKALYAANQPCPVFFPSGCVPVHLFEADSQAKRRRTVRTF